MEYIIDLGKLLVRIKPIISLGLLALKNLLQDQWFFTDADPMDNSLNQWANLRWPLFSFFTRPLAARIRLVLALGLTLVVALTGCATSSQDLESLNRQLFETEAQAAQVQAQQNDRIQELEAALVQSQDEISRTNLLLANLTNQNSEYVLEIQTLARQRDQLSQRVTNLERLLRDLSLAATLTSPVQAGEINPNGTSQGSVGLRESQSSDTQSRESTPEPRETLATPGMMAEVTSILLGESQFITVPTVFPGILPGRTERTFIEGSQVFSEVERDTNIQIILDQRANYGTRVGVFAEVRQPLISGPAARPQELPELWISFQVVANRISANPEIQSLEFSFAGQLFRIEGPQRRELLQDETLKLERISFPLSTPSIRDFIAYVSETPRAAVVLIGENQRIRTQISEVERAAILEVVRTYRELGGVFPN